MYEFVRRQQEQQPGVFASKTFQWMDGRLGDPRWTKLGRAGSDPLAHSSSSVFLRAGPKPGAAFAFRRHARQRSEAGRPPSGISGSIWPARRRGFTLPAAMQAGAEAGQLRGAPAAGGHAAIAAIAPQATLSPPLAIPALPQLQSSFSPPLSPRPSSPRNRSICHRARLLMNRVRGRQGAPLTLSSALCAPPIRRRPEAPIGRRAEEPIRHCAESPRRPRVLPRSPLANAVAPEPTHSSSSECEDECEDSGNGACEDSGKDIVKDVCEDKEEDNSLASSSSDEEGRVCRVCAHYKSLEWLAECDAGHALCFGCVQAHVRRLLAERRAPPVACPAAACAARVPAKQLRACLPPHRMQQLAARRPSGLCVRASSTDSAGRASRANRCDSGFDAPLAPELPAASMPVLPLPEAQMPGEPRVPSEPQMLSELTSVGTASVDSLVIAASAAADSTLTLSPASVGSRLRRVPKALGPSSAISPISPTSPSSAISPSKAISPSNATSGISPSKAISPSMYEPPELSPTSPPEFRASATWMTPAQRHSGYAENLVLSAALFETIRRRASDDDSDAAPPAPARPPIPGAVLAAADDSDAGVYIPTWRRPPSTRPPPPLWADALYGPQSGVLCEAAELSFDLYETLRR
ncbi:hypothetical protein H4S02_006617 [Coemansia sp. RSA 2611]|nr:hypothetical protein H4S02_006617 [Coemansia sp. RSA 2611]